GVSPDSHPNPIPSMEPFPRSPGGFLSALFDFSFRELITPKVIRVLYMLIVIAIGLGSLFVLLGALASGEVTTILFALIGVPIGFLLYVILARVYMEILIVIFRIGEDVADIADRGTL
ncbi:MAG: DUF4282 domain-containing protein, partial [Bacteroidota bacterium]